MKRFLDQNKTYGSFSTHQLVVCPRCTRCAGVFVDTGTPRRARISCLHCGYHATSGQGRQKVRSDQAVDDYFHQPLWLQAPCEGQLLWAFNRDHLHYIRNFIAAELREHHCGWEGMTWNYYSVVNRLPRWAKLAANRKKVLTLIEKMLSDDFSPRPRYSGQ